MKKEFKVSGMMCGGCENAVKKALEAIDGVNAASADHNRGVAEVDYDENRVSHDQLKAAVEGAGYSMD